MMGTQIAVMADVHVSDVDESGAEPRIARMACDRFWFDYDVQTTGIRIQRRRVDFARFAIGEVGLSPIRLRQAVAQVAECMVAGLVTAAETREAFDLSMDGVTFSVELTLFGVVGVDRPDEDGLSW